MLRRVLYRFTTAGAFVQVADFTISGKFVHSTWLRDSRCVCTMLLAFCSLKLFTSNRQSSSVFQSFAFVLSVNVSPSISISWGCTQRQSGLVFEGDVTSNFTVTSHLGTTVTKM